MITIHKWKDNVNSYIITFYPDKKIKIKYSSNLLLDGLLDTLNHLLETY